MAKTPLYLHIQDLIRADYELDGPDVAPRKLPTERELQQRYGVSRPTIAKALAALASAGRLVSTQGRGRYIVPSAPEGFTNGVGRRIGYVASIATEVLTQRTLAGIEREAARRGYRVVMANANNSAEREREAVHDLIASGVRGIVIYPVPRPDGHDFEDYLLSEDLAVPVVLVDTAREDAPHAQFVFDNEQLGYDVAAWLVQHGHRRIAYVMGDAGIVHPPLRNRLRGVLRALNDRGLGPEALSVVHYDADAPNAARRVVADLCANRSTPSALIATEDRSAAALVEALLEAGVRVPDEIVVVGFDDLLEPYRRTHAWPTSRPDFARLGERACRFLLDLLEGAPAQRRTYVYEVPFVVRRTPEQTRARDGNPTQAGLERVP